MDKRIQLDTASNAKFFTIEEAATELGIKPTVVRNYLYEQKFTTYKFKTLTLLKQQEVNAWKSKQK